MITLITGAPGSGKTLYCIDKLIRPLVGTKVDGVDEDGNPVSFDRKIFTNINGLLLDHELVDAAWLEKLPENKQTGAVVVFDEVQRVWPNRPTGSKKPAAVEYLETHRHDGIDVILLTQNPQLLDPAVRALVGRHLHMRRVGSFGGAVVYEWDVCSNALNFKNAFKKTPYKYSKRVFGLYKSAKVHTKQKRSLPFALWIGLAGLAAAIFFWPKFLSGLDKFSKPAEASVSASAPGAPGPGSAPAPAALRGPAAAAGGAPVLTAAEYLESQRPRMLGLPHTAPRYDQVTQPVRAPVPAACLESEKRGCRCWSQDATVIYLPESTCRKIIKDGLFLDFKPDGSQYAADDRVPGGRAGASLETAGAPPAGSGGMGVKTPHARAQPAHVPDDVVTPMDLALASKARTGGNRFARSEVPQQAASAAASGKPAT